MQKSTLLLLPNLLSEDTWGLLPLCLSEEIEKIDALIAENPKSGRAYLKHFSTTKMRELPQYVLNEHTDSRDLDELIGEMKGGKVFGLISDAGVPCLADPGSEIVKRCNKAKIHVRALMGPSSILLALMQSGMSGQRFLFHGYLPRKEEELKPYLLKYEKMAKDEIMTQIWIEAPYRSQKMFSFLMKTLNPGTILSVAKNLTAKDESVTTLPVKEWKKKNFSLEKEPCVFLIS